MAETTFVIPEGYELRQTGDNQYSIVKKEETTSETHNSFFSDIVEHEPIDQPAYVQPGRMDDIYYSQKEEAKTQSLYSDINSAMAHSNVFSESDKDRIFEERYGGDYAWLKEQVHNGRLKLTEHEMNLLRFCDSVNVKEFLKEEFRRHPIKIRGDENGNIWVDGTPPPSEW